MIHGTFLLLLQETFRLFEDPPKPVGPISLPFLSLFLISFFFLDS